MPKREDDEFERDYARIPAKVWRGMKRAVTGELRRERTRRGDAARERLLEKRREKEHRRGHGKHDEEE